MAIAVEDSARVNPISKATRQGRKIGMIAQRKMLFTTAGGHRPHQILTAQRSTALAIGPAVSQHLINPQLQQRRYAVPLHWMLPDNQVGLLQQLLFSSDINIKVRIEFVQ